MKFLLEACALRSGATLADQVGIFRVSSVDLTYTMSNSKISSASRKGVATFNSLGISKWLSNGLIALNITKPTRIQSEAIPAIFSFKEDGRTRRDVFACARTGSGKTLAYVLPILEILMRDPRPYFALILAPTRELAYQINDMIKILTKGCNGSINSFLIKTLLVIGGGSYGDGDVKAEAQGLWFGKPNIVVATPGRFLDQLENRNQLEHCGSLRTLSFDMLVLDEADQLISPSFAPTIGNILNWLDCNDIKFNSGETLLGQKKRQTLVFSATLTSALEQLQQLIAKRDATNKPVIINQLPSIKEMALELKTNPYLDQRYILCPADLKTVYLVELLLDLQFRQVIIFTGSKKESRKIHRVLISLGFSENECKMNPVLLYSGMSQKMRFASLEMFKALKSRILVTTDLANRGLDIPLVDLVINYNVPRVPITYVHRVGRTCRDPEFDETISPFPADKTDQPGPSQSPEDDSSEESEQEERDDEEHAQDDPDDDEEKVDSDENSDEHETQPDEQKTQTPLKKLAKMKEKKIQDETEDDPVAQVHKKFRGKSITMVTQYDIKLVQSIESFIGTKLKKEDSIDEDEIETIIKQVSLAVKEADIAIEYEDQAIADGDLRVNNIHANSLIAKMNSKGRKKRPKTNKSTKKKKLDNKNGGRASKKRKKA